MTQQEIIEGNKMIADFIGYSIKDSNNDHKDEGSYKYHSSWDWLMPVVEKIERLDNGVIIEIAGSYTIANGVDQTYWIEYGGDSKIGNTYSAVIEFIKWHASC